MKKSLALACLISALAASSFAQSAPKPTPATVGARLVAERDSAWMRAHPARSEIQVPMARHGRHYIHLPRFHRIHNTRHVTKR